ncbi:MAG: TldD/PmbA family protein [Bacteroidales bacterium]|nr:TldD/PmbA family protein [Bacteroidales bacterium]
MTEAFLNNSEIAAAKAFMEKALEAGAQKCRVTVSKSVMDLVGVLDGQVDKVTHSMDRSVTLALFADGRFGTFSTNKLEEGAGDFVRKALETVRMMAPDSARDLPSPERTEKENKDLKLCMADSYESMTMELRRQKALQGSVFGTHPDIISEEAEYSDTLTDICIIDSNGTFCRQSETTFDFANEITVRDADAKVSAYWWDSARTAGALDTAAVGREALRTALQKRNASTCKGGRMVMVADRECAARLLTPVLGAMNGFSIQQNNSFLADKLGKKIFPDFLDITDLPREEGAYGSRLFDSEGVATKDLPLVENGVLKNWFVNTYIANKMGIAPTVDDASRPVVRSTSAKDCKALLEDCRNGFAGGDKGTVLITGFNGGNCNSATGDFSFGVEGFYYGPDSSFPVRELVITGNMLDLWNNLVAVGSDARPCKPRVVPTLVFKDVDFSS